MPILRTVPEDFQVEEILREPPSGRGRYLWIEIEKREQNTADVARELAEFFDVPRRAVQWAGRKDRRAVTRQWFSVETEEDFGDDPEIEGVRVLQAARSDDRLRLGEIVGNRFTIVVRETSDSAIEQAEARLAEIARRGMPNRYGEQRFGREGENVQAGLEILRGERTLRDKRRATLMISALQAEVFNRVLRRRDEVGAGIDGLVAGDLAIEHDDEVLWDVVEGDDPYLLKKLGEFQISPTGPIFGVKMRRPRGEPQRLEREVLAELDLPEAHLLKLPRGLRVPGTRRALRIPVRDGSIERAGDENAIVRCVLPSGAYVTVLLEEIFPDLQEASSSVLKGNS